MRSIFSSDIQIIKESNSYNICSNQIYETGRITAGITYTPLNDYDIKVSGATTESAPALYNLMDINKTNNTIYPFVEGETYYITYHSDYGILFRVLYIDEEHPSSADLINSTDINTKITIPTGIDRLIVRIWVPRSTTIPEGGEIVSPRITLAKTNKQLTTDTNNNTTNINNLGHNLHHLENNIYSANTVNLLWSNCLDRWVPGYLNTDRDGMRIEMLYDYSIHIYGQFNSDNYLNISDYSMPNWAIPGNTYYVSNLNTVYSQLRIYCLADGLENKSENYTRILVTNKSTQFTIPADTVSMLIRLYISYPSSSTGYIDVDDIFNPIISINDPNLVNAENSATKYYTSTTTNKMINIFNNWAHRTSHGSNNEFTTGPAAVPGKEIRRTAFVNSAITPFKINLNNPKYVFRLYWFTADGSYHNTAWGSTWSIPKDAIATAITMKDKNDGYVLEYAEKYLTEYNNTVKDYFKDAIDNMKNRVIAKMTEPCLSFIVSTDQHNWSVQGTLEKLDTISDMVNNMRELCKYVKIDGNISLGDIVDCKVGTVEKFNQYGVLVNDDYPMLDNLFYNQIQESMDMLASVHPNFIYTCGNHDDNRYINKDVLKQVNSAYDFTPQEIYAYYYSRVTPTKVTNQSNYNLDYYIDYPDHKIRVFSLHASRWYGQNETSPHGYHNCWWYGYNDSVATWLESELAKVPSDYQVLIISHMNAIYTYNGDNANYPGMAAVKSAIQSFVDNGGNLIAYLYGHSHCSWRSTTPWVNIAFDCQKCQNNTTTFNNMDGVQHQTRIYGEASEDNWNVIVIKPKSRIISIIGFNDGSDFDINY